MDIRATSQYVRMSPRKLRLVADSVKPLTVAHALAQLKVMDKRAAYHLFKTMKSCVANAVTNAKAKEEDLVIKSILIDEGPAFKRFQPVARGMAHGYKKRTSHITVILATKQQAALPKPVQREEKIEKQAETIEMKQETKKEKVKKVAEKKTAPKKGVTRGTKSKS